MYPKQFLERRNVFVQWEHDGYSPFNTVHVTSPAGVTHVIHMRERSCRGSQYGGGVLGVRWFTVNDTEQEFGDLDSAIVAAFGSTRVFQRHGSRYARGVTVQVGFDFFECPLDGPSFGFEFKGGKYVVLGERFQHGHYVELKTTLTE